MSAVMASSHLYITNYVVFFLHVDLGLSWTCLDPDSFNCGILSYYTLRHLFLHGIWSICFALIVSSRPLFFWLRLSKEKGTEVQGNTVKVFAWAVWQHLQLYFVSYSAGKAVEAKATFRTVYYQEEKKIVRAKLLQEIRLCYVIWHKVDFIHYSHNV